MFAHSVAVPREPFGPSPPPLSSEPREYVVMSEVVVRVFLLACVIWPIFSSRVICERQSDGEVHPADTGVGVGMTAVGTGVRVGGRAATAEFVTGRNVSNKIGILNNSIILYQVFLEEDIGTPL